MTALKFKTLQLAPNNHQISEGAKKRSVKVNVSMKRKIQKIVLLLKDFTKLQKKHADTNAVFVEKEHLHKINIHSQYYTLFLSHTQTIRNLETIQNDIKKNIWCY